MTVLLGKRQYSILGRQVLLFKRCILGANIASITAVLIQKFARFIKVGAGARRILTTLPKVPYLNVQSFCKGLTLSYLGVLKRSIPPR